MKPGVSLISNSQLSPTVGDIPATYDGTTAKLYIDGVMDNALGCSGTIGNGSGALFLGDNPLRVAPGGAANGVSGTIANVRIYRIALSEAEVDTVLQGWGYACDHGQFKQLQQFMRQLRYRDRNGICPPLWFKLSPEKKEIGQSKKLIILAVPSHQFRKPCLQSPIYRIPSVPSGYFQRTSIYPVQDQRRSGGSAQQVRPHCAVTQEAVPALLDDFRDSPHREATTGRAGSHGLDYHHGHSFDPGGQNEEGRSRECRTLCLPLTNPVKETASEI